MTSALRTPAVAGRFYPGRADDLLRDMDRHGVDHSMAIPFPVVEDYRCQHELSMSLAYRRSLHPIPGQ